MKKKDLTSKGGDARTRQKPLRDLYKKSPVEAMITDGARTIESDPQDPWHGGIKAGSIDYGISWRYGIHRAVGGDHDAPNPGDLLCAALATCLDSTIRIIADHMGLTIRSLNVDVKAKVDVRGTLVVDRDTPVGFQSMECSIHIEPEKGTDPALIKRLISASEYSCVNLQTLLAGVKVETKINPNN
ncbi:MAG: OsmC family protein [Balneolaceae bacterium]|jgi:uncharacterized OsmC-like protein